MTTALFVPHTDSNLMNCQTTGESGKGMQVVCGAPKQRGRCVLCVSSNAHMNVKHE